MDTTKAASLLAANPGVTVRDLIEGKTAPRSVAKILIPTTAGTGSEWSSTAVVTTDTTDDRTYPYRSAGNYPQAAIIDPALTQDLAARATAETGVDALSHAIEAYTSCRANLVSDGYASAALSLIATSLRPVYAKGPLHMEERYRLSIAAAMAMAAGSHRRSGPGPLHEPRPGQEDAHPPWGRGRPYAPLRHGVQPDKQPGQVRRDRQAPRREDGSPLHHGRSLEVGGGRATTAFRSGHAPALERSGSRRSRHPASGGRAHHLSGLPHSLHEPPRSWGRRRPRRSTGRRCRAAPRPATATILPRPCPCPIGRPGDSLPRSWAAPSRG